MKCPHCGYESPEITVNYGKLYRDAVETRLVQYGFPEYMTPSKSNAAVAIRTVIRIRAGVQAKSGGGMTKESAEAAIRALDDVLPPKEGD